MLNPRRRRHLAARTALGGVIALVLAAPAGRPGARPAAARATVAATTCPGNVAALVNSSFEVPSLGSNPTFRAVDQDDVPGWRTTESDGLIELWANSYLGQRGRAVPEPPVLTQLPFTG